MRKLKSLYILIGVFLFVGIFFGFSVLADEENPYIIDGDSVYINDSNVWINITPHTSNTPVVQFISKQYTGDVDIVVGFDTDEVTPSFAKTNPRREDVQYSYVCEHEFNYTTNPNYFWCYYQTEVSINNQTNETELRDVIIHEGTFETGNIPLKTAYWTKNEIVWDDVSGEFNSVNYNFQDFDKWYYKKNVSVVAGETRYLKIGFTPKSIKTSSKKYFFGIKPSSETLQEAIQNNHFYYIDPWTEALSTNLAGYYKIDEASGTIIDALGNHNSTSQQITGYNVTGKQGGAGDFERSSNDYIHFGDVADYDWGTKNFSVSVWVKPESNPAVIGTIVRKIDGTNNNYWDIYTNNGLNKFVFHTNIAGDQSSIADATFTNGNWYHIVGVREAGILTMYINNVSQADTGDDSSGSLGNNGDFTIGNTDLNNYGFDGIIDEVAVWDRALTSDEVTTLYNSGSGITYDTNYTTNLTTNLEVYLPFSESSGTVAVDTMENYNGTADAGILDGETGINGNSANMTVGTENKIVIDSFGMLSWSMWVYTDSIRNDAYIIDGRTGASNAYMYVGGDDTIAWGADFDTIYINGISYGSGEYTMPEGSWINIVANFGATKTDNWYLGARFDATSNSGWNGEFDEFLAWTDDRTSADAVKLYNGGTGVFYPTFTSASNTAPTLTANATSPASIYNVTDYTVNLTATDPEESYIQAWIQFYVNDVGSDTDYTNMSNATNTLAGTLDKSNFVKTNTLIAEIIIGDGTDNATAVNLTAETVLNSEPVITTLQTAVIQYTNGTYTFDYNATDDDNDTLTWSDDTILFNVNSSTGIITDTPTESEDGLYSITMAVNDGDGNVFDAFTYNISDITVPSVLFNNQTPSDINTLNTITTELNITYNISDGGVGLDGNSIDLYWKFNNSLTEDLYIVNGTATSWFQTTSNISDDGTSFWFNLDDNQVLPATYNFDENYIEITAKSTYDLDQNSEWIKMEFINISNTSNYNIFEFYGDNQSANSNALSIFYCNSTYTTGNPKTNVNCVEFHDVQASDTWNHVHSANSKHYLISMPFSSGSIGSVVVSETSYILLDGVQGNNGWNVYYISNISRVDAYQTSTDNGGAWANFAGTFDAHIHQFNGDETLYYYACANDTNSNQNCTDSELQSDVYDVTDLPPSGVQITSPTSALVNGTIQINWTSATAQQPNYIDDYNITLVNATQDFVKIINGSVNNATFTIDWDTSTTIDGEYFIKIVTTDNASQTSSSYGYNFTLDNNAPNVTISNPSEGEQEGSDTMNFIFTTAEVSSCVYSLDAGATNNSVTTSDNLTFTASDKLIYGDYTVYLYCQDTIGYWNSTSTNFEMYDNTGSSGGGSSATEVEEIEEVGETNKTFTQIYLTKVEILNKKLCLPDDILSFKSLDDKNELTKLTSVKLYLDGEIQSEKLFLDLTNEEYYYNLEDLEEGNLTIKIMANQNGKIITAEKTLDVSSCLTIEDFTESNIAKIIKFSKENKGIAISVGAILFILVILSFLTVRFPKK